MRATWRCEGTRWHLTVRLDVGEDLAAEGQNGRAIELVTDTCRIDLPRDIDEPHPDLLALAAWTIAAPWTVGTVLFDRPISAGLAAVISDGWGVNAGPIDPNLTGRSHGHRPGLSFSGGADSVAVAELIGRDVPHVFLQRMDHRRVANRAKHVRSDVVAGLVSGMHRRGRPIDIVKTDLAYLVRPWPDYPQWTTVTIGSVMLADDLGLDAMAVGTTLESRYLANGYGYRQPSGQPDRWNRLFEAAGLPFFRPASGLTEIVTYDLARRSDVADLVRSCGFGDELGPCMKCPKCFRKELVEAAIDRRPIDSEFLARVRRDHPKVVEMEEAPPSYFQDVLEYACARVPGIEETFLAGAQQRLGATVESTAWMERFFAPAIVDEVPEQYQASIRRHVENSMGFMSATDEVTVTTWKAADRRTARAT